jgi:uroporphyrinogen-III synthase
MERARLLGLEAVACPLFRIEPVEWTVPEAKNYDALLLTSANAVRQAGTGLERLKDLPAHAVGEATASAARDAGLKLGMVGDRDIIALLASLPSGIRLLHLAGEDHRDVRDRRIHSKIVYRSAAIAEPPLPPLVGLVVAVHSPRAGARLGELATSRGRTAIAAISGAAADACGGGWERIEVAELPDDNRLLALAARLCHTSPPE